MRYGILGDIHGNAEALDAVLEALEKESVDRYVSVGDVVGYGADPRRCIARLREIGAVVVAGNHDWAIVGKVDTSFFNAYAKAAVEWTAGQLDEEERAWLRDLPMTQVLDDAVTVVHATLDRPERFDYVQTYYDAARSLNLLETPVCFVGHSHVPLAFLLDESISLSLRTRIDLSDTPRALINVGSIGQPRDENPKAAYAVYDAERREYRLERVRYDLKAAGDKIREAGLPEILAERLRFGR